MRRQRVSCAPYPGIHGLLVARQSGLVARHSVLTEVIVKPEPYVVDADTLHDGIDMRNELIQRWFGCIAYHPWKAHNANHPAGGGDGIDELVRYIAPIIVYGSRVGMRQHHRRA